MESYHALVRIGLTQIEAQVYLALYASYNHTDEAGVLAGQLARPRSGIYRALRRLETYGFVTKWRIVGATHYQAQPLAHALIDYADWQRAQVHDLLKRQVQ